MPSHRLNASSDQKQTATHKGKDVYGKKTIVYLVKTRAGSR